MEFQRGLVAARAALVVGLALVVPKYQAEAVPAAAVMVVAPRCLSVAAVGPGHLEAPWSRLASGELPRKPGARRRSRR